MQQRRSTWSRVQQNIPNTRSSHFHEHEPQQHCLTFHIYPHNLKEWTQSSVWLKDLIPVVGLTAVEKAPLFVGSIFAPFPLYHFKWVIGWKFQNDEGHFCFPFWSGVDMRRQRIDNCVTPCILPYSAISQCISQCILPYYQPVYQSWSSRACSAGYNHWKQRKNCKRQSRTI